MRIAMARMTLGENPVRDAARQYGERMVWREDPMRPSDAVGIYVAKKGNQQPSRKLTHAQLRLRKRSIFKAR